MKALLFLSMILLASCSVEDDSFCFDCEQRTEERRWTGSHYEWRLTNKISVEVCNKSVDEIKDYEADNSFYTVDLHQKMKCKLQSK